MSIFQDLYDSEINFAVSAMWDGGFEVKLGDDMNGFRAEKTLDYWGQVATWLMVQAIEHFPESKFAARYRQYGE